MTIYANTRSARKTFVENDRTDRYLENLASIVDPTIASPYAEADAVHSVATSTQTSGNMTLTVLTRAGETFTTGSIAYNAAAGGDAVHHLAQDTVARTGGDFTLTVTLLNGETFTTGAIGYDAVPGGNAVHHLVQDTVARTGGDFTLTVTLLNGETFTTAAIAYNAAAATIETAIDTAATGVITGWVNGHISVAAETTDLTDGYVSLTFDGASVSAEPSHVLTVMTDSRTGGTAASPLVTDETTGIEAAINKAAISTITSFAYGDIQCAAETTDLTDGYVSLTFDGASVSGEPSHVLTVLTDSRTGGTAADPLVTDQTTGVEAAINKAAISTITGFAYGDIQVTGGAVNANPVVLTFSGDSVDGINHPITVLADVDGAGGAWGAVSITTPGQADRNAWAVLGALGIIDTSSVPTQTAAAATDSVTKSDNLMKVPAWFQMDMAKEAAAQDENNGTYMSIMYALFPQDRSNTVEERLPGDHILG
jgi:hypothetical protein